MLATTGRVSASSLVVCAMQMLRTRRGEPGAVAGDRQIVVSDRRRAPGDQIADKLPGAAGHGPAKRAVAGVLSHRFLYAVRPTTGVPSGVIGRRPVQNVACSTWPPRGNRSRTTISRVSRRGCSSALLKPDDLGHAADANALIEAGNSDFVCFIKDSGNRRAVLLGNRNGQ